MMTNDRYKAARVPSILAGLLVLLGVASTPAAATDSILGKWAGAVSDGAGSKILVILTVDSVQLGSTASMRWNAPKNCSLSPEYTDLSDGTYLFRISSTDGGWCDTYRDGTLTVIATSGTVIFTLLNKSNKGSWKGTLKSTP